jgi:hypothetical protein
VSGLLTRVSQTSSLPRIYPPESTKVLTQLQVRVQDSPEGAVNPPPPGQLYGVPPIHM